MPYTQDTHCTLLRLPCDPDSSRMFKSQKQKTMFLRLHKQKCETCRNAEWSKTTLEQSKKLFDPSSTQDDAHSILRATLADAFVCTD
jgi:hypothetical protein